MADKQLTLMAHLMRRAGFGATRDELENYVAKGYEATVEELLQDESATEVLEDEDIIRRYHVDGSCVRRTESAQWYWLYRMIHTKRPLEEKIAVFWHGIFCVGTTKLNQPKVILSQVDMFRRYGMGSFRTLLVQLSRNPAMLFYLDNKDSHKDALNENYGRELLELFSLGVGMDGHPNYSEDDVRECSRAFTGWTIRNASYHAARSSRNSVWPYGRLDWQFEYKDEDHDDGEKTFLGQKGRFNGEDIIDIICQQPATARFVCRHLYNFFVADEPQVPAWQNVPPRDPEAIKTLTDAFISSGYEIRSVLRVLFNSDFFKNAALAKVKSPVELVAGTARLGGSYNFPDVAETGLASDMTFMGQMLLDPPSVEGWAHRRGVDHNWKPGGPGELRVAATGRRRQAGRQVHNRQDKGPGRPIITRGPGGLVSRSDRAHPRLREYQAGADSPCQSRWRCAIRVRGRKPLRRREGEGDAAAYRRHPGVPASLIPRKSQRNRRAPVFWARPRRGLK